MADRFFTITPSEKLRYIYICKIKQYLKCLTVLLAKDVYEWMNISPLSSLHPLNRLGPIRTLQGRDQHLCFKVKNGGLSGQFCSRRHSWWAGKRCWTMYLSDTGECASHPLLTPLFCLPQNPGMLLMWPHTSPCWAPLLWRSFKAGHG